MHIRWMRILLRINQYEMSARSQQPSKNDNQNKLSKNEEKTFFYVRHLLYTFYFNIDTRIK